jgi:hypothetical protein
MYSLNSHLPQFQHDQQWPLLSYLSAPHHKTVYHFQLFSIPLTCALVSSPPPPLHSTMIQISHRFIDAYSTHSGS